jgi:site-specific DNA-methyltransferase (adenine-specific)
MLFQNNCLNKLKEIPDDSVDLILTDPPYGINYKLNISKNKNKIFEEIKNDSAGDIDFKDFFKECYRVLKPKGSLYLFGRMDFFMRISSDVLNSEFKYNNDFLWLKGDMASGNINVFGVTHESLIHLSKGSPRKSEKLMIDGKEKKRSKSSYYGKVSKKEYYGHPTQKPVGLCAYIIENRTKPGEIVLDPFAGSGSTLVAAKILNRKWIGIEVDPKYFTILNNRMEDELHLKMYSNALKDGFTTRNGSISLCL